MRSSWWTFTRRRSSTRTLRELGQAAAGVGVHQVERRDGGVRRAGGSADYLSKNAKNPKQVLILITDGEDNASSATLEQAVRRIQDLDGPVIYSIGLLFGEDTDKREARHARKVLETISEQTGGVAYFPKSLKEVDAIAGRWRRTFGRSTRLRIARRILRRRVGTGRCMWRRRIKGMGRLDVRTRSGYYPRTSVGTSASVSGSE